MAKERDKIGILFSYSEGWIGGTYYFINLIHSFLSLPDDNRPHVVVVSDDYNSFEKIKETKYPYLSYLKATPNYTLFERIINRISRKLLNKNIIQKIHTRNDLPVLFGYFEQLFFVNCIRKVYWIPDFQDRHYPQYLGIKTAQEREKVIKQIALANSEIVFSSQDSKKDFEHFYPNSNCTKYVIHFAVTLPDISNLNVEDVKDKFGIRKSYFISPNQFWSHKNHITVIKAVEILRNQGKDVVVIFTGNENTGGGKYAKELKAYVHENGLDNNCFFLGFIDRNEQLVLMKNSIAIIQPSLFEGWSTVVEDAKCLAKHVILSDLAVHREQVSSNFSFFPPKEEKFLAEQLELYMNKDKNNFVSAEYSSNVQRFAHGFLDLIKL